MLGRSGGCSEEADVFSSGRENNSLLLLLLLLLSRGTTNRTYKGKLKHLLQSDEGSIFRLHAVVAPIRSHGGHVHRIIIIIVVIMIVLVREVDPELIDEAKVVIAKVFRVVTAREQHVAKQVLSKGFLLRNKECVQQD